VDEYLFTFSTLGVGGLATAARIASSSGLPTKTKVILLEKNSPESVGGRCGSFTSDVKGIGSFRHERGPSLLLLKDVYMNLFEDCGKTAKDYGLSFAQCKPAYQVIFDDGDMIQLGFPITSDPELKALEGISREKMNSFETDGAVKWDAYMKSTSAFLNCGLPNFIEERLDLKSFPAFIKEALRDGLKVRKCLVVISDFSLQKSTAIFTFISFETVLAS
jgi:phytoene dehydrogenase-like protein